MNIIQQNEGSDIYSKILSDSTLREKLVNNILDFVKKYEFNGIELYWDFSTQAAKGSSDKANFVLLLKALREKFDKESLILSVAVAKREAIAKLSYDVKGISTHANFINLMTYNFHNSFDADKKVGANAPLYPSSKENAENQKLNIDSVVTFWLSQDAPPEKLILAIPFSGNNYTLADPKQFGRGAPFVNAENPGGTFNSRPYYKICPLEKNPKWKSLYDNEQKVPYLYQGNKIVSYDNVKSIKEKAIYVKTKNLGGVVVQYINFDDTREKWTGSDIRLLEHDRTFNLRLNARLFHMHTYLHTESTDSSLPLLPPNLTGSLQ
ncbi:acidic mammalian chitinase-like [Belonocnema kinseyi]|uniref:acidic mammalian chitinase-like n=1 Tax=Belonocnema kinseyi TaxID=2817044 RepID=UPI00143D5FA6|nr:acidic mammalian chitinase-like [Belonocnema kinseyi]